MENNTTQVPQNVIDKANEIASQLHEGQGVGIVPIQLPIRTKIYVLNSLKAEELCDMLAMSIPGSESISEIMQKKYGKEDIHLPVDTSTGDFTTEGEYIHIFTSHPCMVTVEHDTNELKLVPFLEQVQLPYEDGDDETSEPHYMKNYIESIFVNDESITQIFKDGTSSIFVFRSRMEDEIFSTFIC